MSTNESSEYRFSQLLQFIQRHDFAKLVKKYKGDFHSNGFSCLLNSHVKLNHSGYIPSVLTMTDPVVIR
ncbi:DUF4372 domain-containing protein [Spirochaeta cellobiosiphila]|uniref:DUF4372 domain-containing protein n=1 Tax=Spirochaeta cellobiosiphila TaxID=504483 RepID=UPI003CCC11CC